MTFFDVPRSGTRNRGFVITGSSYGVDDFAESLADIGSLSRVTDVNDVLARTKKRGVIDMTSIIWPESFRHQERETFANAFDATHEAARVVLDEFWSDKDYRSGLIEALLKARIAYKTFLLDECRKRFEGLEEEAALAVEDELTRREGKLDFTPLEGHE